MRYAVLSDIHSNLEALSAVLEFLAMQRVDRYLCLGDIVGYGADPSLCLTRLDGCQTMMVAGNHEQGCTGKLSMDWFEEKARAAALWTRDHLSFGELDLLRRLPLTMTEGPFTLVHGTLRHPERFEYLFDAARILDTIQRCETLMCLAGHTHVPCFIEYDRVQGRLLRVLTTMGDLAEVSFVDEPQRMRYLLNPGSVGQPRDGDPRASLAVVDLEQRLISMYRIPYDVAKAQQKIRDAGLPGFLADRLGLGR